MQYVNLGKTGLKVSKICLGCMGFGELDRGGVPGKTGEEEAREIIKYALGNGINFFDTANYYSLGASEEILGRALKDFANRDEVVIASKLYYPMFDGANAKGLSRKAIFTEIDKTLERLQTDYLDLYIIHRWDYTTPIEEVMEALNDLVRMGKVRYIGASSMYAWQFIKANSIAEKNGWAKFISMQDMYNLLYREEEKEMIPMCQYEGIAITPWSPLAHGALVKSPDAPRTDGVGKLQNEYQLEKDREIIRRVHEIAEKRNITPSQVALAWVFSKPYITSPLVGASKIGYVEEALKAMEVKLTKEEIHYLEEPNVPHQQYGFR
ncbi:aldo/keto reductase [Alkalicella caledoniensis]|uniref:Aldo/keto reductase n=1 Tax=Alkalicella caledoniensis TaxID=2731377 RepID=A0A7G9W9P0_ALKCA|nr:aldo/keto reductase [Alkalicella caledoniensis]QNO15402.1 aldo/keto reductase [Alkalicella caledoniensis]